MKKVVVHCVSQQNRDRCIVSAKKAVEQRWDVKKLQRKHWRHDHERERISDMIVLCVRLCVCVCQRYCAIIHFDHILAGGLVLLPHRALDWITPCRTRFRDQT